MGVFFISTKPPRFVPLYQISPHMQVRQEVMWDGPLVRIRLCPLSLRAANEEHRCRWLRPRMVCVPASTRSDFRTYRRRCVFFSSFSSFFFYHIGLKTEHWSTRTQHGPWWRCGDARKSAASLRSAISAKTQMLHVASTQMNHMFVWIFGTFTAHVSVTSVLGHDSSFWPRLPR